MKQNSKRYMAVIEYCGSNYHGMQLQNNNLPTVQLALEKAISKFTNGKTTKISFASRTDAGVHAIGQVIHFDISAEQPRKTFQIQRGLNFHLKKEEIRVIEVIPVLKDFDSRFSAKCKLYRYKIINRHPSLTFQKNAYSHFYNEIDIEKMKEGAKYLLGRHDFSTFRGKFCNSKMPFREIESIEIKETDYCDGKYIEMDFLGRSFLKNMIRNIVGSLVDVGTKKRKPEWIKEILDKKDRKEAGSTAPASGLYLVKVMYDKQHNK